MEYYPQILLRIKPEDCNLINETHTWKIVQSCGALSPEDHAIVLDVLPSSPKFENHEVVKVITSCGEIGWIRSAHIRNNTRKV